VTIRFVKSGLP